ncbi:FxSxx-COOH cyclophane-containing RiPP peptide [Streptomyces sp. NPDC101132]|uniref:FxSxx-COOH cyclophane-containing RiPP peptide n=1 Tax=Streptomyces sp. NPDC101132 TaxID=3366110 RepID=UPI003802C565
MVTTRHEPAGRAGRGLLPDLSGLDLATLRGIDHAVLAEVIEGMVERVSHPAEVLCDYDQKAS